MTRRELLARLWCRLTGGHSATLGCTPTGCGWLCNNCGQVLA